MSMPRTLAAAAFGAVSLLALAGCSSAPADAEAPETAAEDYYPITVTDMAGNEVTIESAESVAITDNRFFQLAADWDLPISVAPRDLMSPENPLADDEEILNIGTHSEPDFEQIVAADPDLVINGYRFSGEENAQGVQDAAPDAAFVEMTGPEDQSVDEYVAESLTLMGEVFDRKDEAAALIEEFQAAVDGAKAAYDADSTVMGLITSGGEINYANPIDGRGSSIFFDLLDLTPALDAEGSENHTGDSVSLEALAGANADHLIVLDRDAAVGEGEVTPALDLINSSAALANVPAVTNESIYVFPADYYLTEDVFAYTTVLNGLADLFAQK
ncbi:ABC transporter substrate-binding protein [Microbacterium tenebrionis]|uniref:ABC transporter substrate-binding protein n=1 Tax=Microbacterium tenebrionis TaxID=2830665 RepID=A0A9X1LRI4_9MICO|nr:MULTISPECIES: ABC transporter substrate-binding protein [Microbacterium]MCC2030260.1 ABC transporter substrate-binding protein [Microbacterium tenebrionis]